MAARRHQPRRRSPLRRFPANTPPRPRPAIHPESAARATPSHVAGGRRTRERSRAPLRERAGWRHNGQRRTSASRLRDVFDRRSIECWENGGLDYSLPRAWPSRRRTAYGRERRRAACRTWRPRTRRFLLATARRCCRQRESRRGRRAPGRRRPPRARANPSSRGRSRTPAVPSRAPRGACDSTSRRGSARPTRSVDSLPAAASALPKQRSSFYLPSTSHIRGDTMLMIREIMYCKPGKVRPLVEKFLAMAKLNDKAGMGKMRVMTDFCAERYWTIVSEFEVPSMQAFEKMMQGEGMDEKTGK